VKLKVIFVTFNVLVLLSFLFVFFMPALFLGWEYSGIFWSENWYLAVLFIVVLAILNVYFGRNWRLFSALEAEDWDAVISVIESRIYRHQRISNGNVGLLVNAYVVSSRSDRIRDLEAYLREKRPAALRRNVLLFGIPHLLSNDGAEMARFYGEFVEQSGSRTNEWVRWSYAFALMLDQRFDEARGILEDLATRLKPGLIPATSAYLLDAYAGTAPPPTEVVSRTRERIREALSPREWDKQVERAQGELHVLVLSKLLRDVRAWLYDAPTGSTGSLIDGAAGPDGSIDTET
jgi:hypothetical protein